MPVEIQLVGSPKRWVLERSPVRIGRSPECEVELPAHAYPEVSREHARLVWSGTEVRLQDRGSGNGTYVNGQRVEETTLAMGDTVRLGPEGPELLVRVANAAAAAQEGRTVRVAATAAAMEEGHTLRLTPAVTARGPETTREGNKAARATAHPAAERSAAPATGAAAPTAERIAAERSMVEMKLARLQTWLHLTLALALLLFAVLLYAVQQLGETRADVARLHSEAAAAAGRVAPTLQADQQRLEGMDAHLAAQEQAAEDHFVQRMDQELPTMIDKYMDAKAKQLGLPRAGGGR